MLPWAADLERSGSEVAALPDEFWQDARGAHRSTNVRSPTSIAHPLTGRPG
jgi:hypothetical protein